MKIAELFVDLGIKGSEKTLGAISQTKKGMSETASSALEAKVALVGAMYALERLFAASGHQGTELTNLNTLLGVSTKTLQQYEFAARQVGVSNQELDGTFKALQMSMTKTLLGEGAPKGLARLSQLTGEVTADDLKKFSEQPQLLLKRLQDYALKETSLPLRNEVLKSFGIGDNMIAALSRNAFRPDVFQKAPAYSEKQIASLDRANIAWSNLGQTIEMSVGKFNAKHGEELVHNISKIVAEVLKLAEAFTVLSEKSHLFDWLQKTFEGWTAILQGLTTLVNDLNGKEGPKGPTTVGDAAQNAVTSKKGATISDRLGAAVLTGGQGESILGILIDAFKPLLNASGGTKLGELPGDFSDTYSKAGLPPTPPQAGSGSTQNTNVNQTLIFQHDGKDAHKTADSVGQAIQRYYRQTPALTRGS